MTQLPKRLIKFIQGSEWVFAKTYAKTWPHEYIVEERVGYVLFSALANHIDTWAYEALFYKMP